MDLDLWQSLFEEYILKNPLDDEDPFATKRDLNNKLYAIDHFEEKLLKLLEMMQTSEGKKEAEKRASLMIKFLEDLKVELNYV